MVVAARVATAASAHQESTGICAASSRFATSLHAVHFGIDAGEALDQRDIAERIGRALGEIGVITLDADLQRLGTPDDIGR